MAGFWRRETDDTTGPTFFNKVEQPFYDHVNTEVQNLVGANADYFVLKRKQTKRDGTYDEPFVQIDSLWEFDEPVGIKCIIQEWSETKEATDRGMDSRLEARGWLSRKHADDLDVDPKEGDVIVVWQQREGTGGAWDIIQVNEDGFIGNQPIPTQFVLDLRRRTKYVPERKKPLAINPVQKNFDHGFPADKKES